MYKRLYPNRLLSLLLIYLAMFSPLASFCSDEEKQPSLEDIIRQQQTTIQELKQRLMEQSKEINALKEAYQKNREQDRNEIENAIKELRGQLQEFREDYNQEINDIEFNIKNTRDSLKQAENSGVVQIKELHKRINMLQEQLLDNFDVGMFDGIEFVKIPAGSFVMGTVEEKAAQLKEKGYWKSFYECETPAREVKITKPFLISKCEITQAQWKAMMGRNPSAFKGDQLPVNSVKFWEVQNYIRNLEQQTDGKYRLPTEAEWEYCARAGDAGLFGMEKNGQPVSFETLNGYAWHRENSGERPHPVAEKHPNAFGLYDMLGNVWEWCSDWYECDAYTKLDNTNPRYTDNSPEKVLRGGSWGVDPNICRVSFRSGNRPEYESPHVGFRLVRELE